MTVIRRAALALVLALPALPAAAAPASADDTGWNVWSLALVPVEWDRGLAGSLVCALIIVAAGQLRLGKPRSAKRS